MTINLFGALFMDLYIWAKCQMGRGGEGDAKRFGAL